MCVILLQDKENCQEKLQFVKSSWELWEDDCSAPCPSPWWKS